MENYTLVFLISIWLLSVNFVSSDSNKRVICYHGTWSHYRGGNGAFSIADVDPNLCTHYIYSFAGLSDQYEIKSLDPWLDINLGGYSAAVNLKLANPDLKVLLAVGGWNEGSSKYSKMASRSSRRTKFIKSAVDLLLQYNFDGLDIDWEYPARRGGVPADKQNFVSLLSEMRTEFTRHGLLLTVAVGMARDLTIVAYDIPQIVNFVDFINLMTYDLRGPWDGVTGHHTQLFPDPSDQGGYFYSNLEQSVKLWTGFGIPKSKLNLGMAFYGRTFKVPSNNGPIGTPSTGAGLAGPYTLQPGFIGYNELCEKMMTETWQIDSNSYVAAPWAYRASDWVAYDNSTSITAKFVWGKNLGLGGGMVWSIETDDFLGLCGGGTFPLLRAMNAVWRGQASTPTPQPAPTTPSQPAPTTPSQPAPTSQVEGGSCDVATDTALVVNPADCTKFLQCAPASGGGWVWVSLQCGSGLFFNEVSQACDYTSSGGCSMP